MMRVLPGHKTQAMNELSVKLKSKKNQMAEKVVRKREGTQTTETEMKYQRKASLPKLRHFNSLNLEAGRVSQSNASQLSVSWQRTLCLAFQSIGIVYGDLGTSPLYVFSSTFTEGIGHKDDILGVLSIMIYTIFLVPLLKYVFVVLWANDNGDGGTFALYSLICRYVKVSLIPNNQPEDRELSNHKLDQKPCNESKFSRVVKEKLENCKIAQYVLFTVTIMGTSMVIGDGILTPCISVLSAVSGIKSLRTDAVVGISIAVLILLFSVQQFGTDKVGFVFTPIILLWFFCISSIGLYNLFKYDISVLSAFNPKYIVDYFRRNGKQGWVSLGGMVLCTTGTEAMFADLGHFNVKAIQISFSCITFPVLITAYSGQAAYLRKFPGKVENVFYDSIPGPLYWPTFVVAVAAAIIASQSMISGTFSIISQSLSLGCFPRVKVVHTSTTYKGQVYLPKINYLLMIACVMVTATFKTTEKIGNAYGIAVVSVMIITTCLLLLVMLLIWKTSIWLTALFFLLFISIEAVYLSAVLYKFFQGGFLPLLFSSVLMATMGVWHYVHKQRYFFELKNKVSSEYMKQLACNPNINRIPGMGLLYSELVEGIPPIFAHLVTNIPSIHSIIVIVSIIKSIPISKVALEERFLFRQLEPREYRIFHCVARYGFNDRVEEAGEFEGPLVEHLKLFIHNEHMILHAKTTEKTEEAVKDGQPFIVEESEEEVDPPIQLSEESGEIVQLSLNALQGAEVEMQLVQAAAEKGIVYLLGETEVVAEKKSSLLKKIVVNYAYNFLRKNFSEGEKVMAIPRRRLLRVGMTYEI